MMDSGSSDNYSSPSVCVDFNEHPSPPRKKSRRAITIEASPFFAHAVDEHAHGWDLEVSLSGAAVLMCEHEVVANLTHRDGHEILTTQEPPFELAEDFIDAITSKLGTGTPQCVRAQLEYDLSRWIPEHFCCAP